MKRQEKAGTPVPTSKDSEQPLIGGCGLSPEKAETAEPMLPLEASPTSPSEPNADGRMTDAPRSSAAAAAIWRRKAMQS